MEFQTDSSYVFYCMCREEDPAWQHQQIVKNLKERLRLVKNVKISFVYCECNRVADLLSKIGSGNRDYNLDVNLPSRPSLLIWDICPFWLSMYLNNDRHTSTPHIVTNEGQVRCNSFD